MLLLWFCFAVFFTFFFFTFILCSGHIYSRPTVPSDGFHRSAAPTREAPLAKAAARQLTPQGHSVTWNKVGFSTMSSSGRGPTESERPYAPRHWNTYFISDWLSCTASRTRVFPGRLRRWAVRLASQESRHFTVHTHLFVCFSLIIPVHTFHFFNYRFVCSFALLHHMLLHEYSIRSSFLLLFLLYFSFARVIAEPSHFRTFCVSR